LDETGHHQWYLLSTEERLQLGRLTERPAALLHGLLALQTVAGSWSNRTIDASLTRTGAPTGEKKAT